MTEPVTNWNGSVARAYHEATKHSYESVRRGSHTLDWSNRPSAFKDYLDTEPIALPRELPALDAPAMDALAAPPAPPERALDVPGLARVLRWGAGVVRRRAVPGGGTYHFRTYSSAGALYPVEVYVATGELEDLAAGLYHFHPDELVLRRLRGVDVRDALARAADAPELGATGAVFVLTGILWRTAWKYQARGYRHLYWDAGTMLANVLAVAAAAGLGARVLTGFVDEEVNRLLGVDGEREAALALVALARGERAPETGELEPLALSAAPLSRREVDYAEARELHAASALRSADDVRRYRAASTGRQRESAPDRRSASRESLERVLRRRGSIRDFARDPVPAPTLAAILGRGAAPIPADFAPCNETYLIANAVEGLVRGTYRFTPPDRFELLAEGDFRTRAGYLVLEQPLGALAAATIFLMADLEPVVEQLGNRGYRAAQLEAGIRAGRLQVAAFAEGLGATASTFYDDEVTQFLAPGTALSPMLCVAVGKR